MFIVIRRTSLVARHASRPEPPAQRIGHAAAPLKQTKARGRAHNKAQHSGDDDENHRIAHLRAERMGRPLECAKCSPGHTPCKHATRDTRRRGKHDDTPDDHASAAAEIGESALLPRGEIGITGRRDGLGEFLER